MLYVRKSEIPKVWPLMAASESQTADIRKFEEIGTHPLAMTLAISDAVTFHEAIGPDRKAARLRYLRDTWAKRLLESDRVRLHTSLDPRFSCGIATVEIQGVDSSKLYGHLVRKHRIITSPIRHASFEGIRVSPSVYTTLPELDRFCDAMEAIVRKGLPVA